MANSNYYNEPLDSFEFEQLIKNKVNENLMFFQNVIDKKNPLNERTSIFREKVEYVKKFEVKTSLGDLGFFISIICPNDNIFEVKEKSQEFQQILESIFNF